MAFFTPDDYLSFVEIADPAFLRDQGFGVVLLDIDNTLVSRETKVLSDAVIAWIAELKRQGIKICLLSNNWHKTVFTYAETLELPIVYKAMKPAPFAFFRACKKAGRTHGEKVVMIGDQIVTDVWGAHLFGVHAILVEPLAVKDMWYTLLFRKLEKLLLKDREPRK